MKNWKRLQTARREREAKVDREENRILRVQTNQARREAEQAHAAPLNQLRTAAFDIIAEDVARGIHKVQDHFVETAEEEFKKRITEDFKKAALNRVEISLAPSMGSIDEEMKLTTFRIDIPRISFNFVADLYSLRTHYR